MAKFVSVMVVIELVLRVVGISLCVGLLVYTTVQITKEHKNRHRQSQNKEK